MNLGNFEAKVSVREFDFAIKRKMLTWGKEKRQYAREEGQERICSHALNEGKFCFLDKF